MLICCCVNADGGISKRDASSGRLLLGHEWPENNADWRAGPHNSVAPHAGLQSPFLDYAKYTQSNRGYALISNLVTSGDAVGVQQLFLNLGADSEKRRRLANLVMAGGARPLHSEYLCRCCCTKQSKLITILTGQSVVCGMTRGGNPQEIVRILIGEGADPNSMDNCPPPTAISDPSHHARRGLLAVRCICSKFTYALCSQRSHKFTDWLHTVATQCICASYTYTKLYKATHPVRGVPPSRPASPA